jgi:hypothetical protein
MEFQITKQVPWICWMDAIGASVRPVGRTRHVRRQRMPGLSILVREGTSHNVGQEVAQGMAG